MYTAFKQYLSTLKLSPVSRKLYLSDVRRFLIWLGEEPTLDQLIAATSYTRYIELLRSQATAPSMMKRTLASLKQLGTFLALTYSVQNPMSNLSLTSESTQVATEQAFLNYIKHFTNYLTTGHLSPLTIKSYKSDITRYLDWCSTNIPSTQLSQLLTDKNIKIYLNYLADSGSSLPSTIERKEKSIERFRAWYTKSYPAPSISDNNEIDANLTIESIPAINEENQSPNQHIFLDSPEVTPKRVKNNNYRKGFASIWTPNLRNFVSLAILLIFVSTLSVFGYRQFSRDVSFTAAFPSTPVTPNRQLSFQGRLEDAGGTPISVATDLTFKLFDADTAGTQLYTSGVCSITPDTDGVFSTQIGSTCGAAIASSVFTENASVWLEVTVEAEVLDPRQPIASVAYALNSETIQGFPISSTVSAIRNTVVPMNQWGEIIVGEQSPRLTGVSGTFQISAPSISITTATGTNGNITLAPDGTGQVNLNGNTTSTNFFNVSNAQLTTGSLITGTAANNNTGFKLIDLLSGSSPTSKFSVTDTGLTTVGADLYVASGISLYSTAVSDGTVEAIKFCTGDGESNCVTDFGAISGGAAIWSDAGTYIYPTNGEVLGNAASAGANKLAGAYLADSAPLVFGTDNDVTYSFSGSELAVTQGNNDVNFDANTLFVDGSANYVGIGTNAPETKLHVYESSNTNSSIALFQGLNLDQDIEIYHTSNTIGRAPGILLKRGRNSDGAVLTGDSLLSIFSQGSDGTAYQNATSITSTAEGNFSASSSPANLAFSTTATGSTSPSERLRIDSNGNIGIGTTTPTALLDIAGSASSSGTLAFRGTTDPKIDILNGENFGIRTSVGGDTGLTEQLTVLNNGYVGIGITPVKSLHIKAKSSGDGIQLVGADGGYPAFYNYSYSDTNWHGNFFSLYRARGTSASPTAVVSGDNIFTYDFWGNDGSSFSRAAQIQAAVAGTVSSGIVPSAFYFKTTDTSGTLGTRLTIKNNGQVGIGSGTIGAKLHVFGELDEIQTIIKANSTQTSNLTEWQNSSGTPLMSIDPSGRIALIDSVAHSIDDVGGNLTLTSNSSAVSVADDLYLSSGLSTFSTAVSDGTVEATKFCTGDGETNCVTDFSVLAGGASIWTDGGTYIYPTSGETLGNSASAGANKLAGLYLADSSPLVFGTDNDVTYSFSGSELAVTQGTNDVNFDANTLFIDGSANRVGIGTTTPLAVLDVAGTASASGNLSFSGARSIVGTSMNSLTFGDSSTGDLNFYSSANKLTSAGNLTLAGTITLPNSNTLTGVTNYLRLSQGLSVGGADTYYFNSAGTINANAGTFAGTFQTNGISNIGDGGDTITLNGTSITLTGLDCSAYSNGGTLTTNGSGVVSCANDDSGSGSAGLWQENLGAISPNNSTWDVLVGGTATSSAKIGLININSGDPTATISGNLAISSPTGSNPATSYNILNGGKLDFKTSVGGNAGLTERLTILNNGNVGIGNSSPTYGLDINYAGTTGGLNIAADSITGGDAVTISANSLTGGVGTYLSSSSTAMTGQLSYISLTGDDANNTGQLLTLANTGTSNANTSFYIQHYATGTNNLAMRIDDVSGDTTPFVVDGTGRVGIGTAAPTQALDVNGNIALTGSTRSLYFSGVGDSTIYFDATSGTKIYDYTGDNSLNLETTTTAGAGGDILLNPNTKQVGINTYGADKGLEINSATGANLRLTYNDNNGSAVNYTDFSLASDGDLTIDSSGGNVNIASGDILTVNADIYTTSGISTFSTAVSDGTIEATKFCTGDGETNCVTDFSTLGGTSLWTDGTGFVYPTGGEVLGNPASAGANKIAGLYLADSAPLVFGTNNNVSFSFLGDTLGSTLSSGARIGINTTSALATLDVRGTLGTIPVASISGNTAMAALVVDQSGTGDIFTASKSGDTKFVITNAGNVGIGVSAPTNRLEIGGSTSTISNAAGDITIDSASNNISFAGDSLINMLNLYAAGEVGIGLSDAVAKLDVHGAVVGKALVMFNEIGDQDILTASASGTTRFRLTNDGSASLDGDYLNFGLTDGTTGYGFRDNGGTIQYKNLSGSWTTITSPSAWWDQTAGTVQPYNKTVDLLLGGDATSSAKIALININSGTPTASVSAGAAGATYLTATGILATTAKQTLALGDASTTGDIILQGGNVGIGVASPTQKLEVSGYIVGQRFVDSASSSYYLDPAATGTSLSIDGDVVSNGAFNITSNATNGNITIDAGSGTVKIGSGGAGKLDAGTIDPPYTINGDKFATYMAGMTGVKEETTGTVRASEFVPGAGYRATLDFANSLSGSDLWLFSKTSNLRESLDKLVVLLSTSTNTKTWYDIDPENGRLFLYATTPTTISYRLTAPRYDANNWENTRGADSTSTGHVIDDSESWSVSAAITAAINEGKSQINTLFGNVETNLISPLAEGSSITITAPVVIAPTQVSDAPALIVDGEIEASTISARIAQLKDIQADTITARNIVVDTIEANHIVGLDAKIASLSADISESELTTITDRIKARLSELSGNGSSASDIPAPVEATMSATVEPVTVMNIESNIATSSAVISSLDADFVTINNYLAVIGQATITTLDITNGLYTNTIASKDNLLAIQPMGGIINMANSTLIVDSNGHVAINGDLTVAGKILADSASLNTLEIGSPKDATSSALGQLLAIYNEQGEAVATIDASGSANLASLTTNMITIASSGNDATSSATSELANVLATSTKSNATAGESILVSPNTELTINSKYVTPNSLVYITPTANTDNKVLFVKSKESCNYVPVDSFDIIPACTESFTVAIDAPASSDISFNWWIIELKP